MLKQITAKLSNVLYHITTITAAASILTKDRFELKPSEGTLAEQSLNAKSKPYYMSTTRIRTGGYSQGNIYNKSVVLVLSGTKLAMKYAGGPIDYWGLLSYPDEASRAKRYEAEDRIFSESPFIAPAHKYIVEVHAHINDRDVELFQLKKACLIHKIPIWFYTNAKDLLLLDTKKAVSWMPEHSPESQPVRPPNATDYTMRQGRNSIKPWLALYSIPLPTPATYHDTQVALKGQSDSVISAWRRLRYVGDCLPALNVDMHNAKSIRYDSISGEREDLDKLIAVMRQHHWSAKDFVQAMHGKWYDTTEK